MITREPDNGPWGSESSSPPAIMPDKDRAIDRVETIARHRRQDDESFSYEFQFDDEHEDDPTLWWVSLPSGRGSASGWAGYPIDRRNALDMVRDQVAGLGGDLRIWTGPRATSEAPCLSPHP